MPASLASLIAIGGAPMWVSGAVTQQYKLYTSPLDGDIYQKMTATGVDSLDPANDRVNYVARTYRRTTALPVRPMRQNNAGDYVNTWAGSAVKTAFPVMAANARTNLLSLTGKGNLQFASVLNAAINSALTLRVEVEVDGASVFDNSFTNFSLGFNTLIAGTATDSMNNTGVILPNFVALNLDTLDFRRSVNIYARSTLAVAANQLYLGYMFRSEA